MVGPPRCSKDLVAEVGRRCCSSKDLVAVVRCCSHKLAEQPDSLLKLVVGPRTEVRGRDQLAHDSLAV